MLAKDVKDVITTPFENLYGFQMYDGNKFVLRIKNFPNMNRVPFEIYACANTIINLETGELIKDRFGAGTCCSKEFLEDVQLNWPRYC